MVKIFISAGHSSTDPGAVKHVVERDEVWEIANYVAEELNKINGIKAYREAWEDGWRDTVNKSNNIGCDFFFEFHENAGGGDGAECIIHNTGNQWIADEIKKAFTEIGQQWRRTIVDPTYWVLKYTDCPAMIVECAFVDNWNDIKDWDEPHEKRVMAKSLAKHIAKIAGVDFKPTPSKPTPKPQPSEYHYNPNAKLSVKEAIKGGQSEGNKFCGTDYAVDGTVGADTQKLRAQVLQHAMNIDYIARLDEDGIIGERSKKALAYHTVRKGEIQSMVRALQILLLLNGYNPHGVDGIFGSGTEKATRQFQADTGLTVDGIAGRNTFLKLV